MSDHNIWGWALSEISWLSICYHRGKTDTDSLDASNLFQVSPDPIPLQISKFRPCEINSGAVADTNTISWFRSEW